MAMITNSDLAALHEELNVYQDLIETSQNLTWQCDTLQAVPLSLLPGWMETHLQAIIEVFRN